MHDDIIDEAKLRRGRESVNALWGNNLTVLFGDYLYTKSMGVALEEGNLQILKILSSTTLAMIEGEIIALEREGDVDLDAEGALGISRRKTAELFSAACRIPAHFSPDGGAEASERLAEYGRRLGVSFQLIDDLLDYTARESVVGKPVLSDLREGKLTMPLILSLPEATLAERAKIARVLKERKFESVSPFEVLAIVDRYEGIARTRELALANARAASEPLAGFRESEAKRPCSSPPKASSNGFRSPGGCPAGTRRRLAPAGAPGADRLAEPNRRAECSTWGRLPPNPLWSPGGAQSEPSRARQCAPPPASPCLPSPVCPWQTSSPAGRGSGAARRSRATTCVCPKFAARPGRAAGRRRAEGSPFRAARMK